jgi:hypothetical protein
VLVVEVGALMTTPLLGGLLHDRYLFYLVPLWLVLLCAWIQSGDIPSRVALGAGGAVAVALALTLPTRLVIGESARIDALGIALWVKLRELAPTHPGLVRVWMVAGALGALAAVWLLVPRLRVLLVVPIAAAFVANAVFVWKPRVADADRPVFSGRLSAEATWVDDVVPSGSSVSTLWVSSAQCPAGMRDAFIWTEFFNGRVGRAAHDGTPYLPITSAAVHVGSGGVLRTANGRHLQAAFVVAQPGIRIRGRLLASGTRWHLGLWRVRGDVVVRGVGSTAALEAGACRAPGASQG